MDLQHVVETAVLQSIVPDTLPGSQLQINVLITDADGSVDACAVNAVTLAVADAGMRTLARSTCKCAMQDIQLTEITIFVTQYIADTAAGLPSAQQAELRTQIICNVTVTPTVGGHLCSNKARRWITHHRKTPRAENIIMRWAAGLCVME
jgi:hypothetical protein